jgi:DUF971 family protein
MSEPARIQEADLNEERQALEVRWGDGHRSAYPLRYLRAECPCAGCKAERQDAKANPLHIVTSVPSAVLENIEPVGLYGMRLLWSDGHSTGIYTFEYLREICPCPTCAAARKADDTPYVHGIYIPGS